MTDWNPGGIGLDPADPDGSLWQLSQAYYLDPEMQSIMRRILALFPRPVQIVMDQANALLYENLSLVDKFSFDTDTDTLVLFSDRLDVLIDALIEMAMYLAGFATMMGHDEEWVIEFAVGAWKPVKNRIKRQLNIPTREHPHAVVGLPPAPEEAPPGDPYPFRTMVSRYDFASFHQMVVLAARDDIAVYFPPETHPKALAAYVYMRRAMQEIGQGVGLHDHQVFNTRLVQALQRLQSLFDPANLPPPGVSHGAHEDADQQTRRLGMFPSMPNTGQSAGVDMPRQDPFEDFIDSLFSDERGDEDDPAR